jgi:predicted MFS family arabinose efflux permease
VKAPSSDAGTGPEDTAILERAPVHQIALVVIAQSVQAMVLSGIALFLPLIRHDLGLTFTQAGTLAAATQLVYAVMQIPAGYLADRFSARRLFIVGLVGSCVLGYSFAELHSFVPMLINQALMGFFRSFVFTPGLLLMASLFPARRRATAMGLYVAGGFSSNIFLNVLGPFVVGPLGWRLVFILFSTFGLAAVALFWRLGPSGPPSASGGGVTPSAVLALFKLRVMWLIGGVQFTRLAVVSGLSFWLPTFIVAEKGYSLAIAGLLVALSAALTAPSNLIGGYLSDRLGNPLLVIGGSLVVLAVTTTLLAWAASLPMLVAIIAVNGFFVQLYFGPLFSLPIELLGVRNAGLTSGFGNFFANVGGFTVAYALGAIRDASGSFAIGLYLMSALCLAALLCVVALGRRRPSGQIT